jgi:hypothetical protein
VKLTADKINDASVFCILVEVAKITGSNFCLSTPSTLIVNLYNISQNDNYYVEVQGV